MQKKLEVLSWATLSPQNRDLYLTLLWQDGHSENAIAKFLGTTKGTIVGRRARLKLPNTGRPTPKQEVNPERFRDLLDLHAMQEMEKNGVAAIAPIETKETPPAPPQRPARLTLRAKVEKPKPPEVPVVKQRGCDWPLPDFTKQELVLCGKPTVPGHHLCKKHLALISRHT